VEFEYGSICHKTDSLFEGDVKEMREDKMEYCVRLEKCTSELCGRKNYIFHI
jgi:hypothetical protein